jgi:phage-related protein (TIGR01555 family)
MRAMADFSARIGNVRFKDGLANLVSGAGTTADKRMHAFYTRPFILPEQIEASYRSSWMMRKGIDLPPFDMTRNGRDWQLDEADVDKVEAEEKRLGLWRKLRQALVLGRLGGGLIIMGVGNEDPTQPLGTSKRGVGSLRYLHVMNRWQVSLGQIVMDPADDLFGQPAYFQINYGAGNSRGLVQIHPSRVVAFRGRQNPNLHGTAGDDWFWGDPLMLTVADAVKNAEAAMNGFGSLIDEAKVDTVSIPGLINLLSTTEGEALVTRRVTVANSLKSIHNTRILDGGKGKDVPGETWETRQVAWTGMPDMIRVYCAGVAGAFDIPATRFLGKSPDGMNATGTGDEANYIAKIRADQNADLRPALDQIDAVLLPSAGVTLTAQANYDFPPLQEMSELDEATAFMNTMTAITALQTTAAIPTIAFEKALQHTAVERGWLEGLDGALAEVPEGERFPSLTAPDPETDDDPSALQAPDATNPAKGGDPAPSAGVAGQPQAKPRRRAANDARFTDATPQTLYVSRKLLNAADFIKWAKAQGFTSTAPADELHVTVAFSRQAVDWMTIGQDWSSDASGNLTVPAGGARIVQPLGDKGAVVLLFSSNDLTYRHDCIIEAGASHDFDEYQPHVTITYAAPADFDLSKVQPYVGPLKFGPELFAQVKDNWQNGVTEE